METREIADLLNISPKTVAKYRVAVKQKLNLKNVVEMANYAMRIGLSEIDM
jgi:DNA-binding CsgD family transcriptional regulator